MPKPNFDKCTREATKLLYKQTISDRVLNVTDLKYDRNILFDSIQNYCQYTRVPITNFISEEKDTLKDGCTLYDKATGYYVVLYNAGITYFEHRNWTLGHEIGHIYLGHTKDGDIEEVEAHFFASQLFMPEYSIYMMAHEYGPVNVDALVEIFGVSPEAAKKRIGTMNKKYCVSATEKDKEIWELQKERVAIYYDCLKDGADYRSTLIAWDNYKHEYERAQRPEMYSQMQYY